MLHTYFIVFAIGRFKYGRCEMNFFHRIEVNLDAELEAIEERIATELELSKNKVVVINFQYLGATRLGTFYPAVVANIPELE